MFGWCSNKDHDSFPLIGGGENNEKNVCEKVGVVEAQEEVVVNERYSKIWF